MSGRIGKHNEEIIALYNSGEGIGDISIALAVNWSNVYNLLKNHGLLPKEKSLKIPEIQKLLKKGMEPEEIRKKYHLDRWKIRKAVLYETGEEYAPEEIKELEPQETEPVVTIAKDTRKIKHTQIGGKNYADITDFYNETGGYGW